MSKKLSNFLLVVVSIFFLFISFEIILSFFPVRESSNTILQTKENILHLEKNREFQYSKGEFFQIKSKKKVNNFGYTSDIDYKIGEGQILVIGDSYVEAFQINNKKTFHHLLGEDLKVNVYQMSHSSSQLAQYYEFAKFGIEKFNPKLLIFNFVSGDSLTETPGKYSFNLKTKKTYLREDEMPKKTFFIKTILKSNVVRYFYYNFELQSKLRFLFVERNKSFKANIPCDIKENEVIKSQKSINLFLELINKFKKNNIDILIVFDYMREEIYDNYINSCKNESFASLERKYFIEQVKKYKIMFIDLKESFMKNYEINNKKFNFDIDHHWNEKGHEVVFKTIKNYLTTNYDLSKL